MHSIQHTCLKSLLKVKCNYTKTSVITLNKGYLVMFYLLQNIGPRATVLVLGRALERTLKFGQ